MANQKEGGRGEAGGGGMVRDSHAGQAAFGITILSQNIGAECAAKLGRTTEINR